MIEDIENELNYWIGQKFTGYIKFGIEANEISSLSITCDIEKMGQNNKHETYQDMLRKVIRSEDKFYGNLEFLLDFGKVINFNWHLTLKGTELKSKLIKHSAKVKKNANL